MRVIKTATIIGLALLFGSTAVAARDLAKKSVTVESKGAKRLDISFDFGAGELHIVPSDEDAPAGTAAAILSVPPADWMGGGTIPVFWRRLSAAKSSSANADIEGCRAALSFARA